jgi:hypothetical protein
VEDIIINLTQEQKDKIFQEIATNVAKELGIKPNKVATISTDKQTKDGQEIKGCFHEKTGDIAINDKNIDSTGDAINTLGHELGHSVAGDRTGDMAEGYADIMGEGLEDYANFGMSNYDEGNKDGSPRSLASKNNHNGLRPPTSVFDPQYKTNQEFEGRVDKGEVDYKLKKVVLPSMNKNNPVTKDRIFFLDEKVADKYKKAINKLKKEKLPYAVNNAFRIKNSSDIKTTNTKAKGLSRHQGGFAIDINGLSKLNKKDLKKVDKIMKEYGIKPLNKRAKDYPHFSSNPKSYGYKSLKDAVDENLKDYKKRFSDVPVLE